MYKVFINDTPLYLLTPALADKLPSNGLHLSFVNTETIRFALQLLEQNNGKISGIYLTHKNIKYLFLQFCTHFKIQEAAGGRVHNAKGQVLFIFRRKRWDLPKGKIDKGETARQAAIREVEEECGINQLKIVRKLPVTYHVFKQNEKNILKVTYWFEMTCDDKRKLVPQAEEDIEEAVWAGAKQQQKILPLFYPSLRDVLNAG